eukprot:jgi/Botrbrau1/2752/Bobra.0164s0031.2
MAYCRPLGLGTLRAGGFDKEAFSIGARSTFLSRRPCQKEALYLTARNAIPADSDVPPRPLQKEQDPSSKVEDTSVTVQAQGSGPEKNGPGLSPPPVQDDAQLANDVSNPNQAAEHAEANDSSNACNDSQPTEFDAVGSVETINESLTSSPSGLIDPGALLSADVPTSEKNDEVGSMDTNTQKQKADLKTMKDMGDVGIRFPRLSLPVFNFGVLVERLKFWRRKGSYVPLDFKGAAPQPLEPFPAKSEVREPVDLGTIWGLIVLGASYLHHSTTGYAVPALLPIISPELAMTDKEGALLTVFYTLLYAVCLTPIGYLADRVDRPRLLAAGLVLWSGLTILASKAESFYELLIERMVFAGAQATQNPICFSLIPELFPRERNTAMALYNSAIYIGRALSFGAVVIASKLGVANAVTDTIGAITVPLDRLDLSVSSLLYIEGNNAFVVPKFNYDFSVAYANVPESSWRQLLFWLGIPGFFIAGLCLLTLDEPRNPGKSFIGEPLDSSKFFRDATRKLARSRSDKFSANIPAMRKSPPAPTKPEKKMGFFQGVQSLVTSRAFQAVTLSGAVNDIGSWSLVACQSIFYTKVYDLEPSVFSPALAAILPISGIIGGVGGGRAADMLARIGGRAWITAGNLLTWMSATAAWMTCNCPGLPSRVCACVFIVTTWETTTGKCGCVISIGSWLLTNFPVDFQSCSLSKAIGGNRPNSLSTRQERWLS